MPDHASHERVQRLTGIALMCGAVSCFAVLDTTAKYLNLYMGTLQVVWARYTGAFLFPFIVSNPWTRPGLMRTTRPVLQIGRSMLLLGSTLCNFAALRYLQLDEAIALIFSTPFFVAALSGPMLGEWVRWRRWTAIAVGFVGVIVITRPGSGGVPAGGAALAGGGAVLRDLFHHHAHPRPHRFQRDHAVLLEHRGRAGAAAGRAVRLDHAVRPAGDRADGGHRGDGQLRPLSADRRPPPGAGRGAVALHLYRDRPGDRAGLSWCSATCRIAGRWWAPPSWSRRASTSCIASRWRRRPLRRKRGARSDGRQVGPRLALDPTHEARANFRGGRFRPSLHRPLSEVRVHGERSGPRVRRLSCGHQ